MHIMKACADAGASEFDFSLGDEAYKLDWCEISEPLFTSIIPFTARGRVAALRMRLSAHGHNLLSVNRTVYGFSKVARYRLKRALMHKPDV
jgi:CelD/BcsL family acetyltransferase involved in cellulose biosynthesis